MRLPLRTAHACRRANERKKKKKKKKKKTTREIFFFFFFFFFFFLGFLVWPRPTVWVVLLYYCVRACTRSQLERAQGAASIRPLD